MKYPNNFDIVKCSKELKKLILERIDDLGYKLKYVCDNAGVDYDKFRYYLHTAKPLDKHIYKFKQAHILRICDQLGLIVKIKIIIQDEEKTKQLNSKKVRWDDN